MSEAIYDQLGEVLSRWTMGQPAAAAARIWSAHLGAEPTEAELRLLALAGQFLGVAVTVEPPTRLRLLPDLPVLALPTVPESLRPLVRRLLAAAKEARAKTDLLLFLAARGFTVHPADWLPAKNDEDGPDIYAPWRDWVEMAAAGGAARERGDEGLTAENWEDFPPAARKVALAELRRADPIAARTLLEARFAGESAEMRLRLLGLLGMGLSDADVPFLEGVATDDRAPKVKALAASLLARLGRGAAAAEQAAELAGYFSVQMKGLLRRSQVIGFESGKTPAQRLRRAALFEDADMASFAAALGLTPDALVAAWPWDVDREADHALVTLIARSGTDALVVLAAEAVSQGEASALHRLLALAPRLAPVQRRDLAERLLRTRGCSFEMVRTIAGGAAQLDDPLAAPAGEALLAGLAGEEARSADQRAEFFALGLVASSAGARQALRELASAGLLQGDPRLDMLRLNAALDAKGGEE